MKYYTGSPLLPRLVPRHGKYLVVINNVQPNMYSLCIATSLSQMYIPRLWRLTLPKIMNKHDLTLSTLERD